MHLLKREGVDESWTWDQTMRKIIMDPLYKALDTLAQKKTAFEKVGTRLLSFHLICSSLMGR
jgi:pre-mRNA-processing factor 40